MRVIAGKFRSRPLHSIRGLDVRPTSDRLRETLFDVLCAGNPRAMESSVWLDLFAGTGAVGIEAISRGAAIVYFVESSKRAAELIGQNLVSLAVKQSSRVLEMDVPRAIERLENLGVKANFVFLDPPYRLHSAYCGILGILGRTALAEEAIVITEHARRFDPGEAFGFLHRTRKLEQGDAALSFYRKAATSR